MGKRKLSRQQRWRIEKIQQERIKRACKKQPLTLTGQELDKAEDHQLLLQDHLTGEVVSHYGASLEIYDTANQQIVRCAIRQNIESLVCGDHVIWQKLKSRMTDREFSDVEGVVTARQERQSVLARPDFNAQMKPVAANIDQIFIVTAPLPWFNPGLIDRYLAAAELSHITPVIVLNKRDLLDDATRQELDHWLSIYRNIGYTFLFTSIVDNAGLLDLETVLQDKTSIFAGQSGVGKSSLINALAPEANARTGEISEATRKGRHTTSVARLYFINLSNGSKARVIDSPGVREFGLWNVQPANLIDGFSEFMPFKGTCRFRDCKHMSEPGCALVQAVEEGKISRERLESYHRILASLD